MKSVVYNSKKANVVVKQAKVGKFKIVFTLKLKHLVGDLDGNFQKLMARLFQKIRQSL